MRVVLSAEKAHQRGIEAAPVGTSRVVVAIHELHRLQVEGRFRRRRGAVDAILPPHFRAESGSGTVLGQSQDPVDVKFHALLGIGRG